MSAVMSAMQKNPEWFASHGSMARPHQGDPLHAVISKQQTAESKLTGPRGAQETFASAEDLRDCAMQTTADYHRGAIDWEVAREGRKFRVGDVLHGAAQMAWLRTDECMNIHQHLANLNVPTIFIGGRDDPLIPIETQRATAARVPGARIYEFDCGHMLAAHTIAGTVAIMLAHFTHAGMMAAGGQTAAKL
jgi:pimeloyl-ACP methyl ester carboxylesterase